MLDHATTLGNASIAAFEFNGRIVSCRIARLVRSIRASAINTAPATLENRDSTRRIVLISKRGFSRDFQKEKIKKKKGEISCSRGYSYLYEVR